MTDKRLTKYDLEQSLLDTLETEKEQILNAQYPEELISEFVDSEVPIYNSDLLDVCNSDLQFGYAPEDSGMLPKDFTAYDIIGANIYNYLYEIAQEWLVKAQEEKGELCA